MSAILNDVKRTLKDPSNMPINHQ